MQFLPEQPGPVAAGAGWVVERAVTVAKDEFKLSPDDEDGGGIPRREGPALGVMVGIGVGSGVAAVATEGTVGARVLGPDSEGADSRLAS